jgi:hypothetical protein
LVPRSSNPDQPTALLSFQFVFYTRVAFAHGHE